MTLVAALIASGIAALVRYEGRLRRSQALPPACELPPVPAWHYTCVPQARGWGREARLVLISDILCSTLHVRVASLTSGLFFLTALFVPILQSAWTAARVRPLFAYGDTDALVTARSRASCFTRDVTSGIGDSIPECGLSFFYADQRPEYGWPTESGKSSRSAHARPIGQLI